MPIPNGTTCKTGCAEEVFQFPTTPTSCICTTAFGGISDIYPIPCNENITEENLLDLAWWQGLIDNDKFSQLGKGLGSIAKKSDTKEQLDSCSEEQITSITWALSYVQKCFDKSSNKATVAQVRELLKRADRYFFIARMCDGDDNILPIGRVTVSDFNWTVPETSKQLQTRTVEMSWQELGLPDVLTVSGLSSVIPK